MNIIKEILIYLFLIAGGFLAGILIAVYGIGTK